MFSLSVFEIYKLCQYKLQARLLDCHLVGMLNGLSFIIFEIRFPPELHLPCIDAGIEFCTKADGRNSNFG